MARENRRDSVASPLIEADAFETGSGGRCDGGETQKRLEEAKRQLLLAAPLIAINLLQYCLQMISLMFVGHQGELALSGASMANSFASITGLSVLGVNFGYRPNRILIFKIGSAVSVFGTCFTPFEHLISLPAWTRIGIWLITLNWTLRLNIANILFANLLGTSGALDTLCGQSNGAKFYNMLGIHTQRAVFVLLILSIPLSILWANAKSILIFLGQDQAVAQEAGSYIHFLIPYLFAYAILRSLTIFLSQQNIVFPTALCSGLTTLSHILICWVLVFKSGLGNKGAALANSISGWVNVLLLAFYVKFSSSCAKSWKGFSKEALCNVLVFLRLAIPSAIMACLTIWSSETMILLSGLLPNSVLETSAFSVCLATATTLRMIPYGASATTCIRVSNELGAGHPELAKLAINIAIVMTLTVCVLLSMILLIMRNTWGYAYSNDIEVVRYVANMIPILAISNLLDGLLNVLSGTIMGCGWQKFGAFVTLGSYYLIGIPSAFLLGFVFGIGGMGLWLGVICAVVVQIASFAIIIIRTNWNLEAKKAMGRVHDSTVRESILS